MTFACDRQLTHRRRPFHRAGAGGFTLIEVLAAMFVITVVMLPMIALIGVGLAQRNNGLREYEGTRYANDIRAVLEATFADNLKRANEGSKLALFELFDPNLTNVTVNTASGINESLYQRFNFFNFVDHTHLVDGEHRVIPVVDTNQEAFDYRIMMRVSEWEWVNVKNNALDDDAWIPVRPLQVDYAIMVFDPDFETPVLLDDEWLQEAYSGDDLRYHSPYHAAWSNANGSARTNWSNFNDFATAVAFERLNSDSKLYYVANENSDSLPEFRTAYDSPGAFALIEESQVSQETFDEVARQLGADQFSNSGLVSQALGRILDLQGHERAFHVVQFSSRGRVSPIPESRYASGGTGNIGTQRGDSDFARGAYNLYLVPGFCRAIVTGSISL